MRSQWGLGLSVGLFFLAGCEGFFPFLGNENDNVADNGNTNENDNGSGGTETQVAELRQFASEDELRAYFIEQMERGSDDLRYGISGPTNDNSADGVMTEAPNGVSDADDAPAAPPAPSNGESGAGAGDDSSEEDPFSGTTTQESGVQEADVVKTDGDYLYILTGEELKIVQVQPLELIAEIPLEGYGQDVYLLEDHLVAITTPYDQPVYVEPQPVDGGGSSGSSGGGSADDPGTTGSIEPAPAPDEPVSNRQEDIVADEAIGSDDVSYGGYYYYRPRLRVTVVDITDRAAPAVQSTSTFDGSLVSSRMIGRLIHLVVASYPTHYYGVMPFSGAESDFDDVQLETLLPKYEMESASGSSSSGDIVTFDRFFGPVDPDGFGVTAVVRMDIDNPEAFQAVGVVAEPSIIYASTEALYLTDTAYTWWGEARETTDLYKFVYTESGIELAASGTVPGRIADQYRMGEHEGYLRVATTTGQLFNWETGEELEASGNHVFVLEEQAGKLEIVGRITNIAPGEEIRSARFMGDRGILVTFRQIDPFFTLDLSNPTDPRIVAELKVPGFSTFMVPMDDDHMLTVGQYVPIEGPAVPDGIQLSIFDISDFANPVRSHNVIVSGSYTSSEAVWNPKAFTYFPEGQLLALPMEIYNYNEWWREWDFAVSPEGENIASDDVANMEPIVEEEHFSGLYVYRVTAETGFELLGRISTRGDADAFYYYTAFTRGVFIGDDVYAVTDHQVIGAPVSDVQSVPWSVTINEYEDYYFDDIYLEGETEVDEGMDDADAAVGIPIPVR